MPALVGALLAILAVGLLLRLLRQPHVVGYLLVGVGLGPHGLALITDEPTLSRLGSVGVMLLLFFVGMEVHPRELMRGWKVAVFGTGLGTLLIVAGVALIGTWRDWPMGRVVLLGFIVSLSSTAVVLKLLGDARELESRIGQGVLSILLAQDLALIPMLVIISLLGGDNLSGGQMAAQLAGTAVIAGVVGWMIRSPRISLPWLRSLRGDHEMEVFAALAFCLTLALVTGLTGLSTALGAFLAGMLVGTAHEGDWIHRHLAPFQVVFLALFFVSVGMLLDLGFLRESFTLALLLVMLVLIAKTAVNAVLLRLLHTNWRDGLYAGALLAQIGEFSFVLAAVGLQAGLIGRYGYQMGISVITLSLAVSPLWIAAFRILTGQRRRPLTPLEPDFPAGRVESPASPAGSVTRPE
ncbi:MAG: cation:proton antiporter [Nitrospirota bacterium]|nr:cation:proton antiporter [Nitrospirota bacterium]